MSRLSTGWRSVKARYDVLPRPLQIVTMAIGGFLAVMPLYLGLKWFNQYQAEVRQDVETYQDEVENLRAYVGRMENVERERELLTKRLEGLKTRLVPGDTGTLAAAHLQDHITTLANDTAVSVQSAQVMREEQVGAYRQVTVRLTVRATLKALADFLEGIEYGTMQLWVPFLQIDRRGASRVGRARPSIRGANPGAALAAAEERILASTLEVRGLAGGDVQAPEDGSEPAAKL